MTTPGSRAVVIRQGLPFRPAWGTLAGGEGEQVRLQDSELAAYLLRGQTTGADVRSNGIGMQV